MTKYVEIHLMVEEQTLRDLKLMGNVKRMVGREDMCSEAWVKGENMSASRSSGIPMPVSLTEISSSADSLACFRIRIFMVIPPVSVNFTAFPTRFTKIWRSRTSSVATVRGRFPVISRER